MPVERTFPVIPDLPRGQQGEFRILRTMIYDLQEQLQSAQGTIQNLNAGIKTPGPQGAQGQPGTTTIIQGGLGPSAAAVTSATGSNPNVTQLIGILAQAQRSFIPEYSTLPGPQDPASQNGSLISVNGILYRFNGDVQPGTWEPQAAVAAVLEDTYANWTTANYDPVAQAVGTVFLDTTRDVVYIVQVVAAVHVWVYAAGAYVAATASRPTTGFNGAALGANDKGLRFTDTTLSFSYFWSGAAWVQDPLIPTSATVLGSNANKQIIAAALSNTKFWIGSAGNLPVEQALSGDAALAASGALTLATVNGSPGTFGDSTHVAQVAVNAKGLATTVSNVAIAFPSPPSPYPLIIVPVTVATLPGAPAVGQIASVSNALSPVTGTVVAGGGTAFAAVMWNGAQWTVFSV